MQLLQVLSRDGSRLYGAMIRKQAEIRRNGRGTFLRARARKRNAARWTYVCYKGSINFERSSASCWRGTPRKRIVVNIAKLLGQ
jgi:hypothetical protein